MNCTLKSQLPRSVVIKLVLMLPCDGAAALCFIILKNLWRPMKAIAESSIAAARSDTNSYYRLRPFQESADSCWPDSSAAYHSTGLSVAGQFAGSASGTAAETSGASRRLPAATAAVTLCQGALAAACRGRAAVSEPSSSAILCCGSSCRP